MNDNIKKWVEALRSGKYRQGKGELRSVLDKYCCLGVACELATQSGIIPRPTKSGFSYYYEGRSIDLPKSVVAWYGLTDRVGSFTSDGLTHSLTELNDTGASFVEIADIIESEPAGLFLDISQ